jgi:hypothetical protein
MKINICFKKSSQKKKILFVKTYFHLFETKSPQWKVDVKSYLYFEKPTWNLLLQFEIWKLMHINVTIYKIKWLKWKHSMFHNSIMGFVVIFNLFVPILTRLSSCSLYLACNFSWIETVGCIQYKILELPQWHN